MKMRFFAVVLFTVLVAAIAVAQPDDGPGMAQPPQAVPGAAAVNLTPEQKRAALRDLLAAMINPAKKLDRSTPESTVRSFVWALLTPDYRLARECVRGSVPYEKLAVIEQGMKTSLMNQNTTMRVYLNDLHSYATGDRAVVTFALLYTVEGMDKPQAMNSIERMKLQRWDGVWFILAPPSFEMKPPIQGGAQIMEDVLTFNLRSFIDPASSPRNKDTMCQSYLSQLGLGFMQYLQDRNNRFDLKEDWSEELLPYIKTDIITKCPVAEGKDATYALNNELKDKSLNEIREPGTVILVYEGKEKKFEFRHMNKTLTNILFADGHVKAYTAESLDRAMQNGFIRWK